MRRARSEVGQALVDSSIGRSHSDDLELVESVWVSGHESVPTIGHARALVSATQVATADSYGSRHILPVVISEQIEI